MRIHPGNGFFPSGQGGAQNFKKGFTQMLSWSFTTVFSPQRRFAFANDDIEAPAQSGLRLSARPFANFAP
jgi:hypothetical protein